MTELYMGGCALAKTLPDEAYDTLLRERRLFEHMMRCALAVGEPDPERVRWEWRPELHRGEWVPVLVMRRGR